MADNSKKTETAKDNLKARTTRRKVLMTMVNAGVSSILAEGAEAADIAKYRVKRTVADPRSTFSQAWNAFNAQNFNQQDANGLYVTLDPNNCIMYRLRDQQPIATGRDAVFSILSSPPLPFPYPFNGGLAGAKFVPDVNNEHWNSNNTDVQGKARWTDNDGTLPETVNYDFGFDQNSALITKLYAKTK